MLNFILINLRKCQGNVEHLNANRTCDSASNAILMGSESV